MTENLTVDNKIPICDIVTHENDIARELFPKIQVYLNLIAGAYMLSGKALEAAYPEQNAKLAKQVCTKLLMRLSNDLRAVSMLAEVGYDSQANALTASIYEGGFTIATICNDRELAEEWLQHDDPTRTFRPAKNLTASGLKNYGAHVDWLDQLYQIYRQFCWGKHLNPIAEQQGGIERNGNVIDYIPGPRSDELTERGVCYCCVHAVLFAIIGIELFVKNHVLEHNKTELLIALKELGEQRQELHQQGLARWGSADPFPGKW